ncbi:MAG TPA: DUF222 domain-containing protein [Acidimicrobiia bacterium]|nr:DUF222 domain-containing protein [Acidimicrobiia bacterium]
MSEIRSLLDDLKAVDNLSLSTDELNSDIGELCRSIDQMKVLVAEKTAVLESRGGLRALGFPSVTAYLMYIGRMSGGRARRFATRVKARVSAPSAYFAWSDGRISSDQAAQLFQMAEALPDVYADAEEKLIEIVEPLSVRETTRALEYWRQAVDGPGDLDLESQMVRRGFSLSPTIKGMRRIDGWMTQLAGEALEAALSAHMPPPSPDDTRTTRQRRHDALEEMANCHLAHENEAQVGGERPQIQLLTDIDGLRGIAGGRHETMDTASIVDVETIRLVACDSSVCRIIFGPDSEILDVGRKTRVWSVSQRRAIIARDRTCTWKGCERPARWADIHHLDHWADGGITSVDQGVLLCRFHHVLTHIEEARTRKRRSLG